jgi:hypothetical protein
MKKQIQFHKEYQHYTGIVTVIPLKYTWDDFVIVRIYGDEDFPYDSRIHYTEFESSYHLKK